MLRVFILVSCMESQWHEPAQGHSLRPFTWHGSASSLQPLFQLQLAYSTASPFTHCWVSNPTSQHQGFPKTFGPAGFKFLILPLWASCALLSALALMPMSGLPPVGHWPLRPQQSCLTCCVQQERWVKTCCLPGISCKPLPDCAGMGVCTASLGHGGAEQL